MNQICCWLKYDININYYKQVYFWCYIYVFWDSQYLMWDWRWRSVNLVSYYERGFQCQPMIKDQWWQLTNSTSDKTNLSFVGLVCCLGQINYSLLSKHTTKWNVRVVWLSVFPRWGHTIIALIGDNVTTHQLLGGKLIRCHVSV